eukprot:10881537-Ditylum_brightwellii.AAC.1
MYQLLNERGGISQMSCALGSTPVAQESILSDHLEFSDSEYVTSTNSIHTMDDAMVDQFFSKITFGLKDLYDYLISLVHANSNASMDEKHPSKVWRIPPKIARQTLNESIDSALLPRSS